jgi:hypothetical protein
MQSTELQTLAIDVGITGPQFSMTRVINIFRRADQVDDTKKDSDVDHRIKQGEDAKEVLRTELRTIEQQHWHRWSRGWQLPLTVSSPNPVLNRAFDSNHVDKKG